MSTDTGVEVFPRPREVLEEIVTPVTVGQLCTFCDLPIVQGRFHWLDENDQPQRYDQAFGGAVMIFRPGDTPTAPLGTGKTELSSSLSRAAQIAGLSTRSPSETPATAPTPHALRATAAITTTEATKPRQTIHLKSEQKG